MEKQQHINPEYFKTGLSPEEYSHLAACPFCCEQFADYIENQELITAPAHLKSSIMERSRDLDVQIVAGRTMRADHADDSPRRFQGNFSQTGCSGQTE